MAEGRLLEAASQNLHDTEGCIVAKCCKMLQTRFEGWHLDAFGCIWGRHTGFVRCRPWHHFAHPSFWMSEDLLTSNETPEDTRSLQPHNEVQRTPGLGCVLVSL